MPELVLAEVVAVAAGAAEVVVAAGAVVVVAADCCAAGHQVAGVVQAQGPAAELELV